MSDQPASPVNTGDAPEPRRPALRLIWLGHSTVVLDLGGVRLLTDPLLRRRVGPLVRVGPAPERALWADPDAVLLSHLHHDHADLPSLRLFGSAPVLTGPANRPWLNRRRLRVADPAAHEWWVVPGSSAQHPVSVRLVPAVHHSRPMPHRPNAANGFLVRTPDVAVYVAGDTELHDAMDDLPTLAGRHIDLALLPIGGWGPRLSQGHLDPPTAAEAAARIGARAVLPVHYGTLYPAGWPRPLRGWMQAPLVAFRRALAQRAPTAILVAPPVGQVTTIARTEPQ